MPYDNALFHNAVIVKLRQTNCTMRCVYCQNYEISNENGGRTITPERLAECYKELEDKGVHNINLVTADHFAHAVVKSLEIYKPRIPIVYNCSGYTSPKTLSMLDGLVDIDRKSTRLL